MPVDPLQNIIEQWKIIDKQEKDNPHGMTHNALVPDTIEYLETLQSVIVALNEYIRRARINFEVVGTDES